MQVLKSLVCKQRAEVQVAWTTVNTEVTQTLMVEMVSATGIQDLMEMDGEATGREGGEEVMLMKIRKLSIIGHLTGGEVSGKRRRETGSGQGPEITDQLPRGQDHRNTMTERERREEKREEEMKAEIDHAEVDPHLKVLKEEARKEEVGGIMKRRVSSPKEERNLDGIVRIKDLIRAPMKKKGSTMKMK